jgi:hypothetical protein
MRDIMKSLFDGNGVQVDRRSFLATVGLAAGAAAVLPASALFAAPGNVMARTMPTDSLPDGISDGDSVFGHFPPYAHPIGYGRPGYAAMDMAAVHPADHNFLA